MTNSTIAFFLSDIDCGGAERSIIRLAGHIAELGYPVDLIVGYGNSGYRDEVCGKVNFINFGSRSRVIVFPKLVAYLRSRPPLVIMSALDPANIMLLLASRLAQYRGRRVISQRAVLDASLRNLGTFRRWLTSFLMEVCFPNADALISNSHAAAYELNRRLNVASEKIFTIHNAIDMPLITRLASEPLASGMWQDELVPLIVSVGSLTKRKDVVTLIRAFKCVVSRRAARLVVIGEGPERSALEFLITELELEKSVYLVGFDANPYKWIAAASVFVSTSTEEGFPNVIAESLALGCPVVATDCPGDTAELLGHGRWGRLTSVGDASGVAEAILEVIDDPNPSTGLSRAAEFNPVRNAAAYLDVLLPHRLSAFSGVSRTK